MVKTRCEKSWKRLWENVYNENECLQNENKNQHAIVKMLIENSNKNKSISKTAEKRYSTLNSKIYSSNYQTIALKNH